MDRYAEVTRKTGETDIVVKLDLDGSGVCDISTGVPFFDHMLNAFGRHGLFDLTVHAVGDVEVDAHPVSYTHLDVYKRQRLRYSAGSEHRGRYRARDAHRHSVPGH